MEQSSLEKKKQMADQQLVALVREGRKAVAMWRRENPDVVLDLVDADLSETDLAGVNLRNEL